MLVPPRQEGGHEDAGVKEAGGEEAQPGQPERRDGRARLRLTMSIKVVAVVVVVTTMIIMMVVVELMVLMMWMTKK